jgi:hypothetical protein
MFYPHIPTSFVLTIEFPYYTNISLGLYNWNAASASPSSDL